MSLSRILRRACNVHTCTRESGMFRIGFQSGSSLSRVGGLLVSQARIPLNHSVGHFVCMLPLSLLFFAPFYLHTFSFPDSLPLPVASTIILGWVQNMHGNWVFAPCLHPSMHFRVFKSPTQMPFNRKIAYIRYIKLFTSWLPRYNIH